MKKLNKKKRRSVKMLDMLAIGESLRDVFYFIDEATIHCELDTASCLICLKYAEKIPIKQVVKIPAAGNSSNAAVGASRLGLKSGLVTWVGMDPAGDGIYEALRKDRVDCRYIIVDKKLPTSEATILNFEGERTQLIYFQPRSYTLPKLPRARSIYYSALGTKHDSADRALLKELERFPDTSFFFQPGSTHIKSGLTQTFKKLIKRADVFILNKDEANQLLRDGEKTILRLLQTFQSQGSKNVIITDGKDGAYSYDGVRFLHMPSFPTKLKEATGAGDSFALGVVAALLKGKKLHDALRWGTANSSSVIQYVGPQEGLLTCKEMKRVLQKYSHIKPKEFKS